MSRKIVIFLFENNVKRCYAYCVIIDYSKVGANRMLKIKKVLHSSIYIVILCIIITIIMGVSAASTLSISSVYYDNSKSGGSSTTVSGAIDELYNLVENPPKIVAYTYNENSSASNYCVTGYEDTCVKTKCYESKTAGSCPAGTIIDYMVNDYDKVRFHVMFDEGTTLTMQSQRNTVQWGVWNSTGSNTDEPYMLSTTMNQTITWKNVNTQTYTLGTTVFKTNAYTGCSAYNSCTINKYTMDQKTARSRFITVQEASLLGCTDQNGSCPKWMYNYLSNSTSNGGTADENNLGYWTLNAYTGSNNIIFVINNKGAVMQGYALNGYATRAVVVVNK